MLTTLFLPQRRRFLMRRIHENVLGPEIELFAEHLLAQGFCRDRILQSVQCTEHLGTWMLGQQLRLPDLGDPIVELFLGDGHLRWCHCRPPAPRTLASLRAPIHGFLKFVRGAGLVPLPTDRPKTGVDLAIEAFAIHLETTCGLASATRLHRVRYARTFLQSVFGDGEVNPRAIAPRDVMGFVVQHAKGFRPGTAKVIAGAVKSYLKFLVLLGEIDDGLLHSIPTIPMWKLSHVPRTMPEDDVELLLASFDQTSPTGARDYAMALCYAHLGLRTCEIQGLRVDDIDWRAGRMVIAASKSHKEKILPLPRAVGKAIADYVSKSRPRMADRHIFLRHTRPIGHALSTDMVRRAMERAYRRTGLARPWTGPYVFRHTVATRMLARGARIKDVADVLGHSTIDTTAVYAKVDLAQLAAVALPWPEVEQ